MVAKAKVKRFEVEKVDGTLDFELGDETFHAKPKLSGITLINFVRGFRRLTRLPRTTNLAEPPYLTFCWGF